MKAFSYMSKFFFIVFGKFSQNPAKNSGRTEYYKSGGKLRNLVKDPEFEIVDFEIFHVSS